MLSREARWQNLHTVHHWSDGVYIHRQHKTLLVFANRYKESPAPFTGIVSLQHSQLSNCSTICGTKQTDRAYKYPPTHKGCSRENRTPLEDSNHLLWVGWQVASFAFHGWMVAKSHLISGRCGKLQFVAHKIRRRNRRRHYEHHLVMAELTVTDVVCAIQKTKSKAANK